MSETETSPAVGIHLAGVTKRFGDVLAVNNAEIEIYEGEFFSLLGPSGCGKTTTLRMIAGFEVPDEGRIMLRGEDVADRMPSERNVNMVFQHYALFPHKTVEENIAFGLRVKKVPKEERGRRVAEILETVRLSGYEKRRPNQLSGGQQQRVALARALVNRPAALLLDEPLGALDVKLRREMQLELKSIQEESGTAFVYVTHDQEEALTMSDRIAVMNLGNVEQIGTPRGIYEQPSTAFVAGFIGSLNALDFVPAAVVDGVAVMTVDAEDRVVVLVESEVASGSNLKLAVRPERISLEPEDSATTGEGSRLRGRIEEIIYLGPVTHFHFSTNAFGRLTSQKLSDEVASSLHVGQDVVATWNREHSLVLPGEAPEEVPATAE